MAQNVTNTGGYVTATSGYIPPYYSPDWGVNQNYTQQPYTQQPIYSQPIYPQVTLKEPEPMEFKIGNGRSSVFTLLYTGGKKVPHVRVYKVLVEKDKVTDEIEYTHEEITPVSVHVTGKQVTVEFGQAPTKNEFIISVE